MPLSVRKIGNKWRLVEPSGKVAKTDNGNVRDGGGHSSKKAAIDQQRAISRNTEAK